MSETGPVLTITRLPDDSALLDAAISTALRCRTGLPIPLVDLRIVDADMNDVLHDGTTPGEIVVRAPWLTPCYVGDEAASARLWDGGYLHTQDVATIDPNGYVQIRDRLKDVIKSGGEWISSLFLEDILSRHEAVLEAAVIGVPDDKWGERPVAFVVPRPSTALPTTDSLRAHFDGYVAAGQIPKYGVPSTFVVVDTLDKTSVGKLDKKRLRQRAAGIGQA
jgi:fatty-acyl-CoA synthase